MAGLNFHILSITVPMFLCKGTNWWCKGTTRWRHLSVDFAHSATLSCHLQCADIREYELAQYVRECFELVVIVVLIEDDTVQVSSVIPSYTSVFFLSGQRGRTRHTSTILSPLVVKSLHPLTLSHPDVMFWFPPTHFCAHFPSQSAPSSQRGVSVSKLVVCYAGDFWGRGQL